MSRQVVAIIGAGSVGSNLGRALSRVGHKIIFGVRDVSSANKLGALLRECGPATAATPAQAASDADIVVLAVPFNAVNETIASLGKSADNKVLVDATNPIGPGMVLSVGRDMSAGEIVHKLASTSRVVKCFNTLGADCLLSPVVRGQRLDMYICGEDAQAKHVVAQVVTDVGFTPIDVGGIRSARFTEPLAMLWITAAMTTHPTRDFGFKMLTSTAPRSLLDAPYAPSSSIVEYIVYDVPEGRTNEFQDAWRHACDQLAASPEAVSFELTQADDDKQHYIMRIEWMSADAHMQGFRKSAIFADFLANIKAFIPHIKEMRHYNKLLGSQ